MRAVGIVCEYNPFHNGHKYHIEQSEKISGCDAAVCVMSGNYVQRGDLAVFDKKFRAESAVRGGADLVLELPASFSLRPAELFARGAIYILNSLGCVDSLSFGAEDDNIDALRKTADFLSDESEEYKAALNRGLDEGLSFPAARGIAVRSVLGGEYEELLKKPNNILAVEYLKALKYFGSDIKPFAVKRCGAAHDGGAADGFASAAHIRGMLARGEDAGGFLPYRGFPAPANTELFGRAVIADLCKKSAEEIANTAEVSEGLENRIKSAAQESGDFEELVGKIKTKRYTESKIRRILISSYLGIKEFELPQYIHILAFSEKGRKILNAAKKTATLPIVKNTSQAKKLLCGSARETWFRELEYDRIYEVMK